MISVADMIKEQKEKYDTSKNTFDMFPVGTKVQVITLGQDHNFFSGKETGEVIKNSKRYLSIIVKFDEPRHFETGYIQTEFGFNPDDLIVLEAAPETVEKIKEDLTEHIHRVSLEVKTIGTNFCSPDCLFRYRVENSVATKYNCELFHSNLIRNEKLTQRTKRCLELEV